MSFFSVTGFLTAVAHDTVPAPARSGCAVVHSFAMERPDGHVFVTRITLFQAAKSHRASELETPPPRGETRLHDSEDPGPLVKTRAAAAAVEIAG